MPVQTIRIANPPQRTSQGEVRTLRMKNGGERYQLVPRGGGSPRFISTAKARRLLNEGGRQRKRSTRPRKPRRNPSGVQMSLFEEKPMPKSKTVTGGKVREIRMKTGGVRYQFVPGEGGPPRFIKATEAKRLMSGGAPARRRRKSSGSSKRAKNKPYKNAKAPAYTLVRKHGRLASVMGALKGALPTVLSLFGVAAGATAVQRFIIGTPGVNGLLKNQSSTSMAAKVAPYAPAALGVIGVLAAPMISKKQKTKAALQLGAATFAITSLVGVLSQKFLPVSVAPYLSLQGEPLQGTTPALQGYTDAYGQPLALPMSPPDGVPQMAGYTDDYGRPIDQGMGEVDIDPFSSDWN